MRSGTKQTVSIVDAGNLLFKKPVSITDITNSPALTAAHGIVKAYQAIGYDAVAPSVNDLSAGYDFFRQSMADGFPWVAANVYDENNNPLFQPYVIKKSGNITIGIIGLTGDMGKNIGGFLIGDWRKALRTEIAALEKSCDMLVVLSNLNLSENKELQNDFKQIDIIVTADKKGSNIQPQIATTTLLVESGGRGKYLGRLDISRSGAGNWSAESPGSLAQLQNRLASIDNQLNQLTKLHNKTDSDLSQKIARLQSSRILYINQITAKENDPSGNKSQPGKTYKAFFVPVKPASGGEVIDSIVQGIKKSTAASPGK